MLDSGFWPENLSFSDRVNGNGVPSGINGKKVYQQIPGWNGKCSTGEAFSATHCNQKVIGARYYNAGWGGNAEINRLFPFEFNSPRDWAGHGSHTASTAGGNRNTPATGALTSAFGSSMALHRVRGLRSTRCVGRISLRAAGASAPTPWLPPTRPSRTVWTSSTSRSADRGPISSIPLTSHSCSPPTRACSSRPRRAMPGRPQAPWRTPVRGDPCPRAA